MPILIEDPAIERDILDHRAAIGADRYDEVWEGVTIVSPGPNYLHQRLVQNLSETFRAAVDRGGLGNTCISLNVSDRRDGWEHNFRIPDAMVVLNDSRAVILEAFCLGGPDFVVEILSPQDRARLKFDFYAGIGVREILLIDRKPWAVELHRLDGEAYRLVGRLDEGDGGVVASEVLPLSFGLVPGDDRPTIEAVHTDGRRWTI